MSYLSVSEKITAAIHADIEENDTKVDEIFAALTTQKEVWNIRLATVILNSNTVEGKPDESVE